MPGLVAGTLLFFIPASGDYINAELLGTPNEYMIGNVIDSAFLVRLDYPQGAALSFLLMAAILAIVFVYLRRSGTRGGGLTWDIGSGAGSPTTGCSASRCSCSATCSCRSRSSPASRSTARRAGVSYDFNEFTLDNWRDPCGPADMCAAVVRSAQIGFLATLLATVLGTLMAFALVRHRFRGRTADQPADLPADGHAPNWSWAPRCWPCSSPAACRSASGPC